MELKFGVHAGLQKIDYSDLRSFWGALGCACWAV